MVWDINLFNWIHGLAGWSVFTDSTGIFFAKYLAYLLGIASLFFIFKQNDWRSRLGAFLNIALAVLLSRGIIVEVIRYFYERPRPFAALGFESLIGESGGSFPSGHASFFFAVSFAIFAINRSWGWWFLGLSLLNGLARIFVGVHYPADVAGGILVGLAGWAAVYFLLQKSTHADSKEVQPGISSGN
jgi:undecaprenyl-diphosphatase